MIILQNQKYKDWLNAGMYDGCITFFTPTYNRASFLYRIYDCLKSQTNKHFVWILICDGSVDNTLEVAKELLAREDFPFLFVYKDNGGKHSAFKIALENTVSEFFVCMDDDDKYKPEAADTFLREWGRITKEGRVEEIGAIRTLAQRADGSIVSNVPMAMGQREDCSSLERNYNMHIIQENWTCYRTAALKAVDIFPKDYWLSDKHTFFLEGIWQGRFARKYKCRYYNVVLREYTDDAENSLIRAKKSRKHYLNMFINNKMLLDEQLDYIKKNPVDMIKKILLVGVLRNKLSLSLKELLRNTNSFFLKGSFILILPFCVLYPWPKIEKN